MSFNRISALVMLTILATVRLASAQSGEFKNILLDNDGIAGSTFLRFDTNGAGGFDDFQFFARTNGESLDLDGPSGLNIMRVMGAAPLGSFLMAGNGVGIGVDTPSEQTDGVLFRSDDFSPFPEIKLFIANRESAVAQREQLRLINNGPVRFGMQDTNTGTLWSFITTDDDQFQIRKNGTGTANMAIRANGSFGFNFGGESNFSILGNGNAFLRGTLTENSDRNAKKNINPVNPNNILSLVSELPISTWTYKHDDNVIHLGPMAQDFRSVFGLGVNETSISTIDTSGVALAAIQGLHAEAKLKDEKINELSGELKSSRKELEMVKERMARLEEVVEVLASSEE